MSVNADRKPIEQLEQRKEKLLTKVQVLEDLTTKVDGVRKLIPGMNTPIAIRELALNSDDPKAITGSADKSIAEPGKHSLEVLQMAGSASALSNGFVDKSETRIGTGYIVFDTYDGETKEVFIDYDNSTLEGIAQSINAARVGMHASVVSDQSDEENNYKLMLYADGNGARQDVSFPEFYFAGGEEDFFLESERDARNAIVKYQGYQIELPTNEVKDLIAGATINIKGVTDPGKPATITIEQDVPKTLVKVKDLVEKLNQTFSFLQQNQNQLGDKVPSQKPMAGEYSIRLTESRLREALRENFVLEEDSTRAIRSIQDLGIQFEKNGTLKFDEKRLEHALQTNYEETVELLAGDSTQTGIITKLQGALNSISGAGAGIVMNQKRNLGNQVQALERQIETREKQAEQKASHLKDQLAKAQAAMTAIQSQAGIFGGGAGAGALQVGA